MDINRLRHQEWKRHMIIFHKTMNIAVAKEDGWEKVDYEIVA